MTYTQEAGGRLFKAAGKAMIAETKPANRDEKGRLLPGHSIPGPGRPKREYEVRKLEQMRDLVSAHDFENIVAKAIEQAAAGDSRARQWLSEYILPPRQILVQGLPSLTVNVEQQTTVAAPKDPLLELIQKATPEQLAVLKELLP